LRLRRATRGPPRRRRGRSRRGRAVRGGCLATPPARPARGDRLRGRDVARAAAGAARGAQRRRPGCLHRPPPPPRARRDRGRDALGDAETTVLDLPEFDVGEPEAWRSLEGEFDAAFLNAGTSTGYADAAELTDEEWQRILRANLEGVVYGTRELASRLMSGGGS